MKLLACILLASLTTPTAHLHREPTLDNPWELWKRIHGKQYSHKNEEGEWCMIREKNLELVTLHNLEYALGLHSYTVGMTHMADMFSTSV